MDLKTEVEEKKLTQGEVWGDCPKPTSFDYSLCSQEICEHKESCHRYHMGKAVIVLENHGYVGHHSYIIFNEDKDMLMCDMYWPCGR